MKQQSEPIPVDQQLKFSDPWLKSWCQEYGVSLKMPNKRFSITFEDRVQRIQEYLTNVLRVRIYFFKKFGVEIPIINGDQMPLHRNESSRQKTMNTKNEDVFVREDYMKSRDRISVLTLISTDQNMELPMEFVFKGVGTRTTITPPDGKNVKYQWSDSGSYKEKHMLEAISHLPMRTSPFTSQTGQGYALFILDDYAVHLMQSVKEALLKRGYILVLIGGGITGDVQVSI